MVRRLKKRKKRQLYSDLSRTREILFYRDVTQNLNSV
jgi:hypothetical protein